MAHRGVNVRGRRARGAAAVTMDREMFDECVRTMRTMTNEVAAIKESQRRGCIPDALDHNDEEVEEVEAREAATEDEPEEKLIKLLTDMRGRAKIDVRTYSGSLDPEDLIDWFREMEKYFDIEQIEDPKRVKTACLRLKGHASLWWDNVQVDRVKKGKEKIKSWYRMVSKLKGKFLPNDFVISLFRKLQNFRQKEMTVKEYTEEFYRLSIRLWQTDEGEEAVARYVNGLK